MVAHGNSTGTDQTCVEGELAVEAGDDGAPYPAVDLEHAAVLLAVGFVLAAANRRRAANSTPDDLATVSSWEGSLCGRSTTHLKAQVGGPSRRH
jgi:hypothetical protein